MISLSAVALGEDNPGFKITPALLKQAVYAVLFGDVMMQMLYRCRPYEATPGAANALYEEYMARARKLAPRSTAVTTPSCAARPSARSTPCRSWARAPSRAWA